MPKGQQRSNKESKKPKKDAGAPRPALGGAPVAPPAPLVMERGKKKNA
ncbi:MAG: hypothetical protein ACK520_14105 [Inhella sp.]|jgi:hypothetical protein|nr:hypothetical protein [Inhella sp.]MCZ8236734.1 hypothetical protein [Inhella sp.]